MARNLYQIQNMYPHLKKPERYSAVDKTITCRSGWEISFITKFLDKNPSIISWESETKVIPYLYPIDGKMHRYFIDFYFKCYTSEGKIKEYLVEVKPFAETEKPKIPKRQTKGYVERVHTYIKNQAKWDATRRYCAEQQQLGRNIDFMIVTEKDGMF
jgi:hypothetical protein